MNSKWKLRIVVVCITVSAIVIAAILGKQALEYYQKYQYPYGGEHRCDKALYLALCTYAEKNGKAFPAGEATPEASISLIHTLEEYSPCASQLLHRRDVPKEQLDQIFQKGELPGPDTCGWNYVEGLRLDSSPELALFWDKEGLSEVGMRLSGGGHMVTFVAGNSEHIPESQWADFTANQKKMLAEEIAKRQLLQKPEPQSQKTP
jgi:hypothetical protein